MTQFINAREDLVVEAIDGALCASGGTLARLDGYPHIKVVVRADWDRSKVALISGGGSGHEPAHAGFVGRGMLTAAVCGDVFASPSADAVLAGILAVTGDAGCLLIVKNYTGDRLNFGLAAEQARALGRKVSMVVVGDDVALPDIAQPRGVAGTLFVHKITGAMAESGADLETITDAAQSLTDGVISMGMSLDTCTVPGAAKEDRIGIGKAELGLGIHGEPGVEQVDFTGAEQAMQMLVDRLAPRLGEGDHVALLNNLGSTTPLEMSVLTKELFRSRIGGQVKHLIGPAPLMTSLDMHGFSISLLPVNAAQLASLQAPTGCPVWPGCVTIQNTAVMTLPESMEKPDYTPSDDANVRQMLSTSCTALIAAEAELNALDAKSGDGDTGSTVATAARALEAALNQMPLANHAALFRAIGTEISQSMGGSSGALLAIFFAATGEASGNGTPLVDALKGGLARIQQVGGARLGDRTMIDALAPALEAMPQGLAAAATAARAGANATAEITQAKAGRASYVSAASLKGHNDPGAEAVARLFEHLA